MKKIILHIAILLMAIVYKPINAGISSDMFGHNINFSAGEKLTYKVNYNWGLLWVGAGEVSFEIFEEKLFNRDVFHVKGLGHTYVDYDWFFKVRDRYETYIDKKTLLPLKFIRHVREGNYKFDNEIIFKHYKNEAVGTYKTVEISKGVQDVLSAIYKTRTIDFNKYKKGDRIKMNLFLDNKVYPIHITYLGKEKVKTKLGKFNCIKFKPLLIEGTIFKGGDKMTVWASDDANRIPIRVESPIVVGSIKVDLIDYKGLKHDLSAKIK